MSEKSTTDTKVSKRKDQVDLHLPAGTRALVQDQATKENRSMNAQIVHYVEAGLKGIDNTTLAQAVLKMQASLAALEKRFDNEQ